MISEIQKVFEKQPAESLSNLSLRFGVDPGAMEKMLEVLVAKGRIVRKDVKKDGGHCGQCTGHCRGANEIVYERAENT